jgi:tetratricopeptide (TPR) repeat protein
LISLMFVLATTSCAPARQDSDGCFRAEPSNDLTISTCTAFIHSDRPPPADLADAYYNRGLAYDHKGLFDQAIKDFDQALALKSDPARAYNGRGTAYEDKGLHDQAITD